MAELTHAMMWNEGAQIFRCRTGACSFELTKDEMSAAGYSTYACVTFIQEEDFNGENGTTTNSTS